MEAIGAASMTHSVEIFRETFNNKFVQVKKMPYKKAVKTRGTYLMYLLELIKQKAFLTDRDLAVVIFFFFFIIFSYFLLFPIVYLKCQLVLLFLLILCQEYC